MESVEAPGVVWSWFKKKPVEAARRRRCADRTLNHQDGGVSRERASEKGELGWLSWQYMTKGNLISKLSTDMVSSDLLSALPQRLPGGFSLRTGFTEFRLCRSIQVYSCDVSLGDGIGDRTVS